MSAPTPLLDLFRRGEAARDVRMLAAQGVLAPRAHEQISLLILLLDDADEEVRATASQTIDRIPAEALRGFLARSDVAIGVREFFADRGIFPAEIPAISADDPLLDVAPEDEVPAPAGETEEERRGSITQQLARMNFAERLKAAVKGSREMRAVLIRDPNKLISSTVLSSPKITEQEVASFARMANVSEDVLRIIASNRAWMKSYSIVVGLTKNPKTPLGMSLNMMNRLNDRDLQMLSIDRNVPEPLRIAARKKLLAGAGGRG